MAYLQYTSSQVLFYLFVYRSLSHVLEVEYHADAEYENTLKTSDKMACVGQRTLYPIMEKKKNTLPC